MTIKLDPNRLYTATEISELRLLPFNAEYLRRLWRTGKLPYTRISERKIGMTGAQIQSAARGRKDGE